VTTEPPTPLSEQTSQTNSPVIRFGFLPAHRLAFALAIFTSAFLLFQVEPIIAKMILPWFGGVAAVWAVCLLFFQAVLLLGYSYAHVLTRRFALSAQGRVHAALLVASLLVLRISPRETWKPAGPEHPVLRILLLLLATVGLPFFVLSTTSPLLQTWYANARAGGEPYRFYALSNAGSMLALVGYPILIEPRISSSHQALAWSTAYAGVVLLCAAIALLPRGNDPNPPPNAPIHAKTPPDAVSREAHPAVSLQALWVALAACSSALLLAVTNHISQNIASVPFLWILPLSLYLLSFILCFDQRRVSGFALRNRELKKGWYRRDFFLRMLGVAIGGMTYALSPSFLGLPWKVLILLYCLGLFVCCMFCHGELARLKPAPEHLTSFYLMIAFGGAIGASFVAFVAPRIFSGYYELHAALGLCAVLVLVVHYRDPGSRYYGGVLNTAWLVMVGLVAIVIVSLLFNAGRQGEGTRLRMRNFYGVLRVIDGAEPNVVLVQGTRAQPLDKDPHYRKLVNGTIDHGLQFLAAARRREPTTYYSPNSGVGIAFEAAVKERALRVGAIGLGVGTVAAYGREGDRYTFYEINPLVVKLANEQFTFLRDSPAKIDIVLGDARLSLEREAPRNPEFQFDVLIVDAFSSDSIPVHLLTREAFELYFRHLQPDGVLAVHISNQYLDLQPVVTVAAQQLGKEAVIVNHEVDNSKGAYPATWILVGSRNGFLGQSEIEKAGQVLPAVGPDVQPWTDDYSSLWRVLK
jgi:hypothetical protein